MEVATLLATAMGGCLNETTVTKPRLDVIRIEQTGSRMVRTHICADAFPSSKRDTYPDKHCAGAQSNYLGFSYALSSHDPMCVKPAPTALMGRRIYP